MHKNTELLLAKTVEFVRNSSEGASTIEVSVHLDIPLGRCKKILGEISHRKLLRSVGSGPKAVWASPDRAVELDKTRWTARGLREAAWRKARKEKLLTTPAAPKVEVKKPFRPHAPNSVFQLALFI